MNTLKIVRGIPGSGKTTLAKRLEGKMFSADDFFESEEGYRFDASKLAQAHSECLTNTILALGKRMSVVVHNTFVNFWEAAPYIAAAKSNHAVIEVYQFVPKTITDVNTCHARCVHGVPKSTICKMATEFENFSNSPWKIDYIETCEIEG